MLVVVSPAKSLDMSPVDVTATQPDFQDDAVRLSKTARNLTLRDLKGLMDISDDLARLNRDRFKAFAAEPDPADTKTAALAFNGDTYQGLEAKTLTDDDLAWAQDHLRILIDERVRDGQGRTLIELLIEVRDLGLYIVYTAIIVRKDQSEVVFIIRVECERAFLFITWLFVVPGLFIFKSN